MFVKEVTQLTAQFASNCCEQFITTLYDTIKINKTLHAAVQPHKKTIATKSMTWWDRVIDNKERRREEGQRGVQMHEPLPTSLGMFFHLLQSTSAIFLRERISVWVHLL